MRKLIFMILSSLLIANQVQAKAIDENSQEEFQEIVGQYHGCNITKDVDEGSLNFKYTAHVT